jgi:hypothetical protein
VFWFPTRCKRFAEKFGQYPTEEPADVELSCRMMGRL